MDFLREALYIRKSSLRKSKKMKFHHIKIADIDWSDGFFAQKTARVEAEFIAAGTEVITRMASGHVETTNTAPAGGAFCVTNPSGERYIITPDNFSKRYVITEAGDYAPRSEPVLVKTLKQNTSLIAAWGEKMEILSGGVLVQAGPQDVYGIQAEEFKETYSLCEPKNQPDHPPALES